MWRVFICVFVCVCCKWSHMLLWPQASKATAKSASDSCGYNATNKMYTHGCSYMFMHLHTHNQSTIAQDSWGCYPIVSICPVCYFVCVCVVSSTVAVLSGGQSWLQRRKGGSLIKCRSSAWLSNSCFSPRDEWGVDERGGEQKRSSTGGNASSAFFSQYMSKPTCLAMCVCVTQRLLLYS